MSKLENISNLYPHNQKIFLKVLENLKTYNKVGVVQATGTGKGKLASCFVEFVLSKKKNAKILIAAPLRSVLENYRDNFNMKSKNIVFATYSKINNLSDVDLINIGQQYDLIILDEYHRCGATEWFKSIQILFNGVDKGLCKVVGLTATPIRYLDNSRNMSEELFDNNVIEGLNLEDAILDGILPGFVYNACYFGTEKVLKEVEDKLKNNDYKISDDAIRNDLMVKVRELNMLYQNRLKIENIIKEGTKELGQNQKWVIFCKGKQSLLEIKEFCVNWFNYKPHLYVINSDRKPEDNDRTLVEFRSVKQGVNVLLCIDMLNEGVHIKDLNGVIMLRKTDSPILFLQQLGRSLEVGKDFKPIIFDLIGNYKGLKVKENEIERTPISIVKGIEEKTKGRQNYVIVHNFTEEFDSVLEEIKKVLSDFVWSKEDIEILKVYYPLGGSNLCIEKGINRTNESIRKKANVLGLSFDRTWSEEEIEILKKFYPLGGVKLCIDNGLNRTVESIRSVAKGLDIHSNSFYWTDKEIEIVKNFYPLGGYKLCQENGLNYRNKSQIYKKAEDLGLTELSWTLWSDAEIEILKKYYPIGGASLCQEKGLKRTSESITQKVSKLGIKKNSQSWSDAENNILLKYYSKGGWELCIEKGLNRTCSSIISQASKLGLKTDINSWRDDELKLLYKYYPLGGASLCIEKGLNDRTVPAIKTKAKTLGIKIENYAKPWSKEEIDILYSYYPLGGLEGVRKKGLSDRTDYQIRNKVAQLGIKRVKK